MEAALTAKLTVRQSLNGKAHHRSSKLKPCLPVYARPPNKLLRYEEERFTDRSGNSGIERVAVFIDAKGKTHRMAAQIIWDKEQQIEQAD